MLFGIVHSQRHTMCSAISTLCLLSFWIWGPTRATTISSFTPEAITLGSYGLGMRLYAFRKTSSLIWQYPFHIHLIMGNTTVVWKSTHLRKSTTSYLWPNLLFRVKVYSNEHSPWSNFHMANKSYLWNLRRPGSSTVHIWGKKKPCLMFQIQVVLCRWT